MLSEYTKKKKNVTITLRKIDTFNVCKIYYIVGQIPL